MAWGNRLLDGNGLLDGADCWDSRETKGRARTFFSPGGREVSGVTIPDQHVDPGAELRRHHSVSSPLLSRFWLFFFHWPSPAPRISVKMSLMDVMVEGAVRVQHLETEPKKKRLLMAKSQLWRFIHQRWANFVFGELCESKLHCIITEVQTGKCLQCFTPSPKPKHHYHSESTPSQHLVVIGTGLVSTRFIHSDHFLDKNITINRPDVFSDANNSVGKKKIELLIGREYFHTEREYHTEKKWPFHFQIAFHFPELSHCKQTHHPIMMVVQTLWPATASTCDRPS